MDRRVTADTRLGGNFGKPHEGITVRDGAALGGFELDEVIRDVERMITMGVFHWIPGEDRLVALPFDEDGNTLN